MDNSARRALWEPNSRASQARHVCRSMQEGVLTACTRRYLDSTLTRTHFNSAALFSLLLLVQLVMSCYLLFCLCSSRAVGLERRKGMGVVPASDQQLAGAQEAMPIDPSNQLAPTCIQRAPLAGAPGC